MSVSVNQSTRKSIQTTKTFNSNLTTQSTPEITLNITNEEIKDPTPLPTIPNYRILVRPVSIRATTKGGIILPD